MGDIGPVGPTGEKGKSAYEIAVENGFTGSEQDWLSSIEGPTGPVGTILDSFNTLADLEAAHKTGSQGDAYLVDGDLYTWNEETQKWKNVGNLRGPTGPVGTILDSFDTLFDLEAAHKTGNQGDAYLVDGDLYTWNEQTKSWKKIGNLRGETGPTGPAGTDGIIGQIGGVVATVDDLPNSGVAQGTIYYVEADNGVYVWDASTGTWKKVNVAQGPRGATGPTGPTGPAGADGIIGRIDGVVATVDDLPDSGVAPGAIYYVEEDSSLYVWDASSGSWKKVNVAQGPRGATGPSGLGTVSHFYSGLAHDIIKVTGGSGREKIAVIGDNSGADFINPNDPVKLSAGNSHLAFPMPIDGKITAISAFMTATAGGLSNQVIHIKAQLFKSETPENDFFPIEDALVEVGDIDDLVIGSRALGNTVTDLNVPIKAGTRLIVVYYSESTWQLGTSITGYMNGAFSIEWEQ